VTDLEPGREDAGKFAALTMRPGHDLRTLSAPSSRQETRVDAASHQNDDENASPAERRDDRLNAPSAPVSSPGGAPG
jgi:hypothetical protein